MRCCGTSLFLHCAHNTMHNNSCFLLPCAHLCACLPKCALKRLWALDLCCACFHVHAALTFNIYAKVCAEMAAGALCVLRVTACIPMTCVHRIYNRSTCDTCINIIKDKMMASTTRVVTWLGMIASTVRLLTCVIKYVTCVSILRFNL